MYYEQMALEVGATVAGFDVLKPPVLRGTSGVDHRFTFAAADGPQVFAFDIYQQVTQIEIIRTYVKKMDTGVKTYIVCLSGKAKDEAKELSAYYGIDILGPKEIGDFFSSMIEQRIKAPRQPLIQ